MLPMYTTVLRMMTWRFCSDPSGSALGVSRACVVEPEADAAEGWRVEDEVVDSCAEVHARDSSNAHVRVGSRRVEDQGGEVSEVEKAKHRVLAEVRLGTRCHGDLEVPQAFAVVEKRGQGGQRSSLLGSPFLVRLQGIGAGFGTQAEFDRSGACLALRESGGIGREADERVCRLQLQIGI